MSNTLKDLIDDQAVKSPDYRPELYRLKRKKDREALESLVGNMAGIKVYNEIERQVRELVKLRHASAPLDPEQIKIKVSEFFGGRPKDHLGIWVYYPWSQRVVHILDEEEFREVRTSRNQYKITREEQELLSTKKLGVVGLSVGQSVALALSMERIYGELRLADFDELELSNMNRIRSGIHELGVPKVVLAAREIAEIDPFLKVNCFPEGLNENNFEEFLTSGGQLDILVDECDDLVMKIKMRQKAKELKMAVIMDTSDRGMLDVERFDLEPDRPLFHGRLQNFELNAVDRLTPEERMNFLMTIIDVERISERGKMSLAEVGKTITTWPQLASSVTMGGGVACDVCRRILLDQFTGSGRYYVDVEKIIND